MESPPSSCAWSEAFILSEDSGLLLTNSSISSGSMSADEHSGSKLPVEFQDSDCEDKSLSQDGSLDGMSDIMCGENFNTLKKGVHWTYSLKQVSPIAPPPEFQDKPTHHVIDWYSSNLSKQLILRALKEYKESSLRRIKLLNQLQRPMHLISRHYWPPDFIPFSPCHIGRPNSRSSLYSSRLSSSHNSLSLPSAHKVDDSSFITQAVSHDTLTSNQISDLYNVPFDSDVYAVPVDVVKPPIKPKRNLLHKKRRRYTSSGFRDLDVRQCCVLSPYLKKGNTLQYDQGQYMLHNDVKRHSVAGTSAPVEGEPIHMTLEEVRRYLQTLYSSSSESSEHKDRTPKQKPAIIFTNNNKYTTNSPNNIPPGKDMHCVNFRTKKNMFLINIKNKKVKDSCDNVGKQIVLSPSNKSDKQKKQSAKIFSFKQALCNIFRFRKFMSTDTLKHAEHDKGRQSCYSNGNLLDDNHINRSSRALPPLPLKTLDRREEHSLDFATSIQRVKDYGWYWGPLSSESAEKILSNEPDGSFIVRDSSDDHYIFSLTFKLNDYVRHVRIEHDQGNFSFGTCTKFKSQTIVEFIENAVEHSRSGRYLFFLHRRPVIGPVRVQLLHPVSRFKQVQRLQHMCRFVIHKVVRRDLIPSLPLPRRMIDYLNTPHYYSEHVIDIEDNGDSLNYTSAGNQSEQENIVQNIEISNVPGNDYVMLDNPTPQSTRQS